MHDISQFIDVPNIMFAKLALALFLGGLIGTERAVIARQAAGTRTFGLVAMGACLMIMTSNFVDAQYLGVLNYDPMRLAAGIITGIGFLGGGLIIFRGDALHGVTTAAGLWIVTAIGIAVAYGLYAVSIYATLLTLIVFTGMWYVEDRFKHWFMHYQENHSDNGALL